jgi:NhaP-type Na+/H+ or K+/H+ antiporter
VVVGEAISVLFGANTGSFDWIMLLYAVLSLTVVRMLPTFVSLTGLGLSTETKLFVGWFGPRGLASIVFAVIVIEAGLPHAELLALVVTLTVVLSIVAHGFTAKPWARAYGRRERASQCEG